MNDTISRRDFTLQSILALLSGVTITITDCGGDDYGGPTSPGNSGGGTYNPGTGGANPGDVSGVISNNHGHTAVNCAWVMTAVCP